MALNWVQQDPSSGSNMLAPLALPDEHFILHTPLVDLTLLVPASLEGPKRKEEDVHGEVWVSKKRLVFMANTAASANGPTDNVPGGGQIASSDPQLNKDQTVKSVSIPWAKVSTLNFQQPLFSANHLLLRFHPVVDGGFPPSLLDSSPLSSTNAPEVKLVFKEAKVHEIYRMMHKCWTEAKRPRNEEDVEALPLYTPASSG